MARLLLTWEAGSHLGHRAVVTSAALALGRAGHEVHVFAPDGIRPERWIEDGSLIWRAFPGLVMHPAADTGWESRVTTLQRLGLGHADVAAARIKAWVQVYDRVGPAAVLAQAAPFAQVAARLLGLPTLEFGIGFDVPPCTVPFSPYRNEARFDGAQALAAEAGLVRVLRGCAAGLGLDAQRVSGALAPIVCGDLQMVTSLSDIDHYGGLAGQAPFGRHVVGPLPMLDLGEALPPWSTRRPRLLAYVRSACMDITAFIDAVSTAGAEAIVVCPDAGAALVERAALRGVRLCPRPASLEPLLASAQAVVCHGTSLVGESLARGVPCVMFPSQFEQFLCARRLAAAGLGLLANPAQTAHYAPVLRRVLTDRALTARAARRRREVQDLDAAQALVKGVERLVPRD
jgi:UDP:flavonoid glycosyltransferase YjiC (YdhE family)